VYDLKPERVNQESLDSGELELLPLGSADLEILADLLREHRDETGSTVAAEMLEHLDEVAERFVKVLPRDYAAVLATRQNAVAEGLDPDSDVVWTRILEVTGG
jgi:glutamate synthase (NADPH/NADH) large chain